MLAALTACATARSEKASTAATPTGSVDTPGCASPSPGETLTLGGKDDSMYYDTPDTEVAIDKVKAAGEGQFADSYAGMRVDPQHGVTSIYRVPDAAFDAFIVQAAGRHCFRLYPALHSAEELKPWRERIEADLQSWPASVPVVSVSTDQEGKGIRVGTEDIPATEAAFRAKYGADAPIFFVQETPGTLA